MTTDTLTMRDLTALHVIASAAERGARVRWLIDDDTIGQGTARSIGGGTDDVRDGYLRITSLSGVDHYVPVRELMDLVHAGAFAVTRSAA